MCIKACQNSENEFTMGNLTRHALEWNNGSWIFMSNFDGELVYLFQGAGIFQRAPYLNEFGEPYTGKGESKPDKYTLNQGKLAQLTFTFL